MQGAARDRTGTRVTRFIFTLNNWTQAEYDAITKDFAPNVQWIVVGKETGENGTPHLQGACVLGSRMAFSKLKKTPGFLRAHIESMRGTPQHNLDYSSKEDKTPFEMGEMPQPGKRNDLATVVNRVQSGESMRDLARDEQGGVAIVKFHKGLTILRSLTRTPRTEPPKIFWIWGPTGWGKTRICIEACAAILNALGRPSDDWWINNGTLTWFDGYDGQTCAIIDDVRAKQIPNFSWFLRFLDRNEFLVPFKGGFINWMSKYIFITCPYDVDTAFAKRKEHVPEDLKQLHRRISGHGGAIYQLESDIHASDPDRLEIVDGILAKCGFSSLLLQGGDGDGHDSGEDSGEAGIQTQGPGNTLLVPADAATGSLDQF